MAESNDSDALAQIIKNLETSNGGGKIVYPSLTDFSISSTRIILASRNLKQNKPYALVSYRQLHLQDNQLSYILTLHSEGEEK